MASDGSTTTPQPQESAASAERLVRVADLHRSRSEAPGAYQIVGSAACKIWGRDAVDLLEQGVLGAGFKPQVGENEAFPDKGHVAIFRGSYFFDRSAVELVLASLGCVVVEYDAAGGIAPLCVRCSVEQAPRWRDLLQKETVSREDLPPESQLLDASSLPLVFDYELRKTSRPFVLRIGKDTRSKIESVTFALAYKGVTDVITKYLYPGPAFHATRLAANLGIRPNTVTAGSLLFVFAVLYLFAEGQLALGLATGFFMSFLDTVDGKLARVTQTSSPFGKQFDHKIDQIHPPFWWMAWWWGGALGAEPQWWNAAGIVCVVGYVVLRFLESKFKRRFGVRIHVWKRFDSRFRLFTSRRNTNLVLLSLATIGGRPELGLAAVAFWTVASFAVHATRWTQAEVEIRRGGKLASWLETSQAS